MFSIFSFLSFFLNIILHVFVRYTFKCFVKTTLFSAAISGSESAVSSTYHYSQRKPWKQTGIYYILLIPVSFNTWTEYETYFSFLQICS